MSDTIAQLSASVDALTREFEIITHNLANASTVGYKRRCNAFARSMDAQETETSTFSPGEVDLSSVLDFSQGGIVETRRPLDLALYGKGFFVIETPEGQLYTRNGTFSTNQNGQLVDLQGRTVAGEGGPITIPNNVGLSQLHVSSDGSLSAGGTTIGRLSVVDFGDDQSKLVSAGESCYRMPEPDIQPVAAENVVVKQGYHEASNVKIVDELVDMIMVSRLYEANMKFITARKETSSSLISTAMG